MKRTSLIIILISILYFSFAQNIINPQKPNWVKALEIGEPDTIAEESYQYILLDYQNHLQKDENYYHFAVKILNAQGIQDFSNLELQYDPSYESIKILSLQIIRNGRKINKLYSSKIEVVQRETDYERAIYDGRKSVLIIIDDVREGDILEYSYCINGANPINGKFKSGSFYQEYSVFVNRIYNRIVFSKNQQIRYKLFEGAKEPEILKTNGLIEYIWDENPTNIKLSDQSAPSWYNPYKSVEYTNFKSWEEIVNWALPIYKYDNAEIDQIIKKIKEKGEISTDLISIVRFIQDQIRYLGIESGIYNYKPHAPKQVYQQRYGDCKDKSFLMIALLRNLGYEAYPLLVNTYRLKKLPDAIESNQSFNHMVVNVKHNGKDYYFDATSSGQGGDLERSYFYDYGYGLLIKEGISELTKLPKPKVPKITIEETFTMDSIGGGGFLHIKSTFTGSKADDTRNYFQSQNYNKINKGYLDFYANLYPSISSHKPIIIKDESKNSANKFEVNEYYRIDDLWTYNIDSSTLFVETFALVLIEYLNFDRTANRKMPMYIGEPFKYKQISTLKMPTDWDVDFLEEEITHEAFNYKSIMNSNGNTVVFMHQYEQFSSSIEADQLDSFFNKLDLIYDEFSLSVIYQPELENFNISWASILITVFTIIAGFFIFRKLYRYDPEPKSNNSEPREFGGWLILPLIGCILTPVLIIILLFNTGFFNQNLWDSVITNENISTINFVFLIIGELIFNILLLGYSILIIILFLKKRSNLPLLIVIFYVSNFSFTVIDVFAAQSLGIDVETEDFQDVFRAAIQLSIWVPYFFVSKRVKETFVNRFPKRQLLEETLNQSNTFKIDSEKEQTIKTTNSE